MNVISWQENGVTKPCLCLRNSLTEMGIGFRDPMSITTINVGDEFTQPSTIFFRAINVQNVLSGAHRGIRNCKQRREKKPAAQKPSLASNITLRARFPFNAALQMRLGFRRGCNPNPIVLDQGLGNLGRKLDNRLQRWA